MSLKNDTTEEFFVKDLSDQRIRVWQKVIVNIVEEGDYQGVIVFLSEDRNRIQLKNVIFCETQANIFGRKQFYRSEIHSIKIIGVADFEDETEDLGDDLNEKCAIDESQASLKFEISDNQFKLMAMADLIKDYVYIDHKNEEFRNAIEDISKHDFVAINAEGIEDGRKSELTLLELSTTYKIYILNLTRMGVDPALRDILSSDKPVKVIHNASLLSDNLYHCHGVTLNGVFDTMVAHMALGYSRTRTTLRECIAQHMILPTEFMKLLEDNQDSACVSVLLKFHEFLTENLLENAYAAFNENLNFSRHSDPTLVGCRYAKPNKYNSRLTTLQRFKLNNRNQLNDETNEGVNELKQL